MAGQEELLALGEHIAPGGGVDRLDAGVEEGQGGLEDDGVGHQDGGVDHDRRNAVAHHVLEQDPRDPGPHDLGGGHVVLAELGEDIGPHHAGQLGGVDDGGGDDDDGDHRQALDHGQDQDGGQRDAREGHEHVQHAHDELADPLAAGRGDRPQDAGQRQGDPGGAQPHHERDAGAVDGAREDVAAGLVGAERVLGRGRDGGVGDDGVPDPLDVDGALDLGQAGVAGVVGGHDGGEDRHGGDEGQDDDGDLGSRGQPPPALEAQPGPGEPFECAAVGHQTLLILGLTST